VLYLLKHIPQAAAAAAKKWGDQTQEGLQAALSLAPNRSDACAPTVQEAPSMFGTLHVSVCVEDVEAATSWLTEQVCVS